MSNRSYYLGGANLNRLAPFFVGLVMRASALYNCALSLTPGLKPHKVDQMHDQHKTC